MCHFEFGSHESKKGGCAFHGDTSIHISFPAFLDSKLIHHRIFAGRGIKVPEQISLVTEGPDVCFRWCKTPIAHVACPSRPIVRRIVRWAKAVSEQRPDVRQMTFLAEFVPGGTIGPVDSSSIQ